MGEKEKKRRKEEKGKKEEGKGISSKRGKISLFCPCFIQALLTTKKVHKKIGKNLDNFQGGGGIFQG